MINSKLEPFLVALDAPIRSVLECISRNGKGIALLVDAERNLLATVTDGDVRRAILADIHLAAPAAHLLEHKRRSAHPEPTMARVGTEPVELLAMMERLSIRQIPLVDEQGQLVDLALKDELASARSLSVTPVARGAGGVEERSSLPSGVEAVIMAGGFGKRLQPLTSDLPKPMLPVGDRPMLERLIEQVRKAGVKKVHLTTHYMPEVIREHFGNGDGWGIEICYVHEETPLGTGGSLGLVAPSPHPMLVINGDILTNVDLAELLRFHLANGADLTVAVRQFDMQVPYGVVRCREARVETIEEKPCFPFLVNAGVYVVNPSVRGYMTPGERLDMTDVIQKLIDEGDTVAAFPIVEYWLDIGRMEDYERAQSEEQSWRD